MNGIESQNVYQLALKLQREIFEMTKSLPTEERFSLSFQIRKTSRTVGAKIADSWYKRRYTAYSLAKLSDACSECAKTRHWLQTCVDCEYLDAARFDDLTNQCLVILDELNSMIRESESWQITL